MVRVKICGITNPDDAVFAAEAGADALGFVFYRNSRRFIEPEKVADIISILPPFTKSVGVFVDADIEQIRSYTDLSGVDIVQLHGNETPDFCNGLGMNHIKAVRIVDRKSLQELKYYKTNLILLDNYSNESFGGTGDSFNWDEVIGYNFDNKKIILSGGLKPENVKKAINILKPDAVDVSSGVENSPGIKNHDKIKKFIQAVRNEN